LSARDGDGDDDDDDDDRSVEVKGRSSVGLERLIMH
jgi:hypothetical protein